MQSVYSTTQKTPMTTIGAQSERLLLQCKLEPPLRCLNHLYLCLKETEYQNSKGIKMIKNAILRVRAAH